MTPMKPTKTPDIETLALLAAIVGQGMSKCPHEAVDYAWKLWEESEQVVEHGYAARALTRGDETFTFGKSWEGRIPKKFPGRLDDFLRLIVKARTPADSTKRLRDFFSEKSATDDMPDPGAAAAARIQKIKDGDKAGGYFTSTMWRSLAVLYEFWWQKQKSNKARVSAKKRRKN